MKKEEKLKLEIAARVLSGFISTGLYEDVEYDKLIRAASSLARALMVQVRKDELSEAGMIDEDEKTTHIYYTIK